MNGGHILVIFATAAVSSNTLLTCRSSQRLEINTTSLSTSAHLCARCRALWRAQTARGEARKPPKHALHEHQPRWDEPRSTEQSHRNNEHVGRGYSTFRASRCQEGHRTQHADTRESISWVAEWMTYKRSWLCNAGTTGRANVELTETAVAYADW